MHADALVPGYVALSIPTADVSRGFWGDAHAIGNRPSRSEYAAGGKIYPMAQACA